MISKKKIGIVILNYNDVASTLHILKQIQNYSAIDHIVIVDNLSPDGSFQQLKSMAGDKVDVIQSDKNGGYSYGNNYGAFYLIEKYMVDILVIANPDVEFSEAFLIRVVQDMIHLHVQAASGYMKMPDSQPPALLNRKINSYWHELLSCTVLLKRIIHSKINYVLPNQGIIQVEWLPGALFAIDSFVYKQLHGLDDRVFLFYEEQILGKKFLKSGYKMIIDTDVSFLHNHSVSTNKSMKRFSQARQMFISRYYYLTNYEEINVFQKFLLKLVIEYGIFARRILYKI